MFRLRTMARAPIVAGTKVLVRIDANIQVHRGHISDDATLRLKAVLPTLRYLLRKRATIILVSHRGEPKGRDRSLSLRPIATHLGEILGRDIRFITAAPGSQTYLHTLKRLPHGGIAMLENIRFHRGETANDPAFAARLAKGVDIFINDAFATCHRPHASIVGVTTHLKAYAGLLVQEEVKALARVLHPKHPLIVVMGGAKVSTKIATLEALIPKAQHVLVGGGIGNAFLAAKGNDMAKSMPEKKEIAIAKKILRKYARKIVMPQDLGIRFSKYKSGVVTPDAVPKNVIVADVGPQTIKHFAMFLNRAATVVWNGPLGIFEQPPFDRGTLGIARALAHDTPDSAYIVVGGGETVTAIERSRAGRAIDHLSTGGGAMLEFLAHGTLPGLAPLILR